MQDWVQPCPNCGNRLRTDRAVRQTAGAREVVLQWLICESCRHVMLAHWSFVEPAGATSTTRESRPSSRADQPHDGASDTLAGDAEGGSEDPSG
ncbi:MAG: hypothetical protein M3Z66_19660 [Chloroflexota bacterium]|nr:hypothetical protein [Chloroflexota bacterium]